MSDEKTTAAAPPFKVVVKLSGERAEPKSLSYTDKNGRRHDAKVNSGNSLARAVALFLALYRRLNAPTLFRVSSRSKPANRSKAASTSSNSPRKGTNPIVLILNSHREIPKAQFQIHCMGDRADDNLLRLFTTAKGVAQPALEFEAARCSPNEICIEWDGNVITESAKLKSLAATIAAKATPPWELADYEFKAVEPKTQQDSPALIGEDIDPVRKVVPEWEAAAQQGATSAYSFDVFVPIGELGSQVTAYGGYRCVLKSDVPPATILIGADYIDLSLSPDPDLLADLKRLYLRDRRTAIALNCHTILAVLSERFRRRDFYSVCLRLMCPERVGLPSPSLDICCSSEEGYFEIEVYGRLNEAAIERNMAQRVVIEDSKIIREISKLLLSPAIRELLPASASGNSLLGEGPREPVQALPRGKRALILPQSVCSRKWLTGTVHTR